MEDLKHIHAPGEGKPKNFTQMISLGVGALLFLLGLCGMLYSGFAGLNMGIAYALIIAIAGVTLFYLGGYKNNSKDAFYCCSGFTLFFGLHALAGWVLGRPGNSAFVTGRVDERLLRIIPGFHELGTTDHILNTVIGLVLLGGAIDWWRRKEKAEDGGSRFNEKTFTKDHSRKVAHSR